MLTGGRSFLSLFAAKFPSEIFQLLMMLDLLRMNDSAQLGRARRAAPRRDVQILLSSRSLCTPVSAPFIPVPSRIPLHLSTETRKPGRRRKIKGIKEENKEPTCVPRSSVPAGVLYDADAIDP